MPFPSPGDLPNPRIEPRSLALQSDSLPTELSGKPQFLKSSFKKAGSAEKSLTQTILTYPIPPLGGGFSTLVPLHSQVMLLLLLSHFSHVRLCATLWTIALQALLSRGFSKQEYWSRLPLASPGDLPNPRIEPASLTSLALAGRFFTTSATWEA